MSSVNNSHLLSKAVTTLHANAAVVEDRGPVTASALKPSRSLVFPSPDFKLDEKENAFLKFLIFRHKFLPHLSLLDLLFFDLYHELGNLKGCMRPEDFETEIQALEQCYANLTEDATKAADLQAFLKGVILRVIVSNNKLRQPVAGSTQQVKAIGDTKLITESLFQRVQLFQKFAGVFITQPEFILHPLSILGGNDRLVAQSDLELALIFSNNSHFLKVALRALSRTNEQIGAVSESLLGTINKIHLISDPLTDMDVIRGIQVELLVQSCRFDEKTSPCLSRIFYTSFPVFNQILSETYKHYESKRTDAVDLAFQVGKAPYIGERSRELLDPKDILSDFKIEHYIEPYFYLTDPESELLRELFNTVPLDSRMTLFDVLGFAFYQRFETIREKSKHFDEKISECQGFISAYCLQLYVGLQRTSFDQIEELGSVNKFTRKWGLMADNFIKYVDSALTQIQDEVKSAKVSGRKPTQTQVRFLEDHKRSVLEQITQSIIPLRNLYEKLLTCKRHYNLLLRGIATYQGYEALDRRHKDGRVTVKRYFDYVRSGLQAGAEHLNFGVRFKFKSSLIKELFSSARPKQKDMAAFGTKMADKIHEMDWNYKMHKSQLEAAVHDGLTHEEWLAMNGLKSHSENKTHEEFIEQLFFNMSLTGFVGSFLSDLLRLMEHRVYPRGTLTTETCAFRLMNNMHRLEKNEAFIHTRLLSDSISIKFDAILGRIETLFSENKAVFDFSVGSEGVLLGSFDHPGWLELLLPIAPALTALLEESLADLSALKEEIILDLKNQWLKHSLEQLRQVDIQATKEALFQEGLQLMRPLWILGDMLALLQRRHYSEEAAIIPPQLADIMELDGIQEMLDKLIAEKTPAILVEPSPLPVKIPAAVTKVERPPQSTRSKKAGVPKKQQPKVRAPVEIRAPQDEEESEPLPELQELAHLTKSRQILERLEGMGFTSVRQTGSHHILSGPEGGTVVVPNNNNLPRGTRQSIAEQVMNALK